MQKLILTLIPCQTWLRLPSTLENSRKLLSVLLHPLIFFRALKPLKQNKHKTQNKNKQTRNLSVAWQIPSPGAEYEVNVLTIQNLISIFFWALFLFWNKAVRNYVYRRSIASKSTDYCLSSSFCQHHLMYFCTPYPKSYCHSHVHSCALSSTEEKNEEYESTTKENMQYVASWVRLLSLCMCWRY